MTTLDEVKQAVAERQVQAEKAAKNAFTMAMEAAAQAGIHPLRSVTGYMKTDDFIAIRGFGKNRDVKRIDAEKNTHLRGELTSEQQNKAVVVITNDKCGSYFNPDFTIMKLDGHSRTAAWLAGKLEKPEFMTIDFLFELDEDQIIKEYRVLTESKSQATQAEKNGIDRSLNNFNPESKFVQTSWADAFKKLDDLTYDAGLKKYGALLLDTIDKWNIKPEVGKKSTRRHSTGIKMAIIRTYNNSTEDLTNWETFWKDFFAEESKIKQCITLRTKVKSLGTHNPVSVKDAAEDAFRAFEKANTKKAA